MSDDEVEGDLLALRDALAAWMRSQGAAPAEGIVAMIDLSAAMFGRSIAEKGMPRSECFECWETVTSTGLRRLLCYYDDAVAARSDD